MRLVLVAEGRRPAPGYRFATRPARSSSTSGTSGAPVETRRRDDILRPWRTRATARWWPPICPIRRRGSGPARHLQAKPVGRDAHDGSGPPRLDPAARRDAAAPPVYADRRGTALVASAGWCSGRRAEAQRPTAGERHWPRRGHPGSDRLPRGGAHRERAGHRVLQRRHRGTPRRPTGRGQGRAGRSGEVTRSGSALPRTLQSRCRGAARRAGRLGAPR